MRRVPAFMLLLMLQSLSAFAQVVGQGSQGSAGAPWFVTGTVTFDNLSIQIGGSLPTGTNTIGAVNLAQYTPNAGRLPVFGPVTDAELRASPVPVSGTFWQATQPVSGTVTANAGTGTFVVGDGAGALNVICDSGCGGAATFADNAAFTFGTTSINISGFVFDDTAPNAATENSAAAPRMSGNRVPYGILRDAAGNERGANVNASNALLIAQTGELPAGTQNIGDVDVASLPNEGQQTMANSISVAIASNQSAVAVSGQNSAAPIFCSLTAFLNMTTATTTQVVALSGSTHIYVCSYAFHVGGASDVKFVSGTGSNCGTSTADVTTTYDFATADVGINRVAGGGNIVARTETAGDALCATSSVAVDVDVEVSYAQF